VIVWDRGTYERTGLVPWPAALDRGLAEFRLDGEKLRGDFTLQRHTGRGKRSGWWLVKQPDKHAKPGPQKSAEWGRSVVSGRTLDDLLSAEDGPVGDAGVASS
jgi:hypothetical protein